VPVAGSALMQQLAEVGVAPPQVKPGGRRKRAVQARVDMDAASLLLGTISKICGHEDFSESTPTTMPGVARTAGEGTPKAAFTLPVVSSASSLPSSSRLAAAANAREAKNEPDMPAASDEADDFPGNSAAAAAAAAAAIATAAMQHMSHANHSCSATAPAASGSINKAVPFSPMKLPTDKENATAIESPRKSPARPSLDRALTPAVDSPCRLTPRGSNLRRTAEWADHPMPYNREGLEAAMALQGLLGQ